MQIFETLLTAREVGGYLLQLEFAVNVSEDCPTLVFQRSAEHLANIINCQADAAPPDLV